MDIVLDHVDSNFFTPYIYPNTWRPDDAIRQFITLFVVTNIGGALLYLVSGTFSYFFLFDHELMKHHLFLKVQFALDREQNFVLKD